MKTFAGILASMCVVATLYAQKSAVQSAANYLKYEEYEKAKTAIDKAYENPTTSNHYKMWYYRGKVYLEISEKRDYSHLDPKASMKSAESFIKYLETDKKGYYEDGQELLIRSGFELYSDGVAAYKAGKHAEAITFYEMIHTLFPHDEKGNLKRNNVSAESVYQNTYYAAVQMKDYTKAKACLEEMIKLDFNDPIIYLQMSKILLNEKDTAKALKYVEMGRATFDDDKDLINAEMNIYVWQGRSKVLIEKLTEAIEMDPEYELLYFNRGTLLEKNNDLEGAKKDYDKAIAIRPDYFDAVYNRGAMEFNRAIQINNDMNALDVSEQKKYDELKASRDDYLKKALPFLEKAHELEDEDLHTMLALKEIYLRTDNLEKSGSISSKIAAVKEKKKKEKEN